MDALQETMNMQLVKLFKGIESDVRALENDINTWLRESGAKVITISGNIAPQSAAKDASAQTLSKGSFAASDILVLVLYEEA